MSKPLCPRFRMRIYLAPDVFLGPGKADLLQGIVETGSIAAAGRCMNLSYKRAWYLVDTLQQAPAETPAEGPHAMIRLLARVIGVGVETADMLVNEILSRNLRDQKAVARYAGLTGSPDESGKRSREKGLSRAGNARVRRGMVQLAWHFLLFQKESALAQWYRGVTKDARGTRRKTMIVALARKLLIALWRMVTTGEMPEGVAMRAT